MRIDTRSSLDCAAKNIRVFLGVLEQGAQMADDLKAHTLLVTTGQCWGGEGLCDKVGGPSSQLDIGIGTGKRQDAYHDLRVVCLGVAEHGFLGLVQLLELVAHGLYVGRRHDGRQEADTGFAAIGKCGSGRPRSWADLLASTLRFGLMNMREGMRAPDGRRVTSDKNDEIKIGASHQAAKKT